jgi:flagellin-specific chaperone FliS
MSKHYEKHAEQVISGFMDLLDEEAKSCISESDLAELTMMVEAAISTAALQQLQKAADEVEALSKNLRQYAEHYDKA